MSMRSQCVHRSIRNDIHIAVLEFVEYKLTAFAYPKYKVYRNSLFFLYIHEKNVVCILTSAIASNVLDRSVLLTSSKKCGAFSITLFSDFEPNISLCSYFD